ncbi:MAG: nicotinate (nicotinamide) nucleotide adenylyltransferase [Spirochaetia bacterium]|nr:nicotinate (nicotinamide) nucleotide adenylyltransferase [Spirochaetota bacterium]MCX8097260.1 nicotinate (nicotinamide) nucleotide adenylyltransferase [Spirochaetota bacterium]MDW8111868.1 nicotinate (nicotinamide) nucleotide adenylyltransferase [Spirochaetia bacterium]
MKVILFGGTFDPPHIGHLVVAELSLEYLKADKVIFIPSKVSPFKANTKPLFSNEERLEMVRLSIQDNENFEVSNFEIMSNKEVSYTYLTIQHFTNEYPKDEFFLLIGGDNLKDFHKWRNYEFILTKVKLVVYPRFGYTTKVPKSLEEFKDRILFLNTPLIDISSTSIRERIIQGKDVRYFLHHKVYEYIKGKFR